MLRTSSTRAAESAHPRVRSRRPLFFLALSCAFLTAALPAHAARRCDSPATARRHPHRKLCVKAHVYQEINLADGTRILDVCSPRDSARECHFAFVSLMQNRAAVGSLKPYIGKEIEVRGIIRPLNDRAEILLTRAKQIRLAPKEHHRKEEARAHRSRFHPNPALLKGFNATQSRMPIADPAFRGGYRN